MGLIETETEGSVDEQNSSKPLAVVIAAWL